MYWWSNEIGELRKDCIRKKRKYLRIARKNVLRVENVMWSDFVQSKKVLKVAIKRSKKRAWKDVCDSIDKDVWGKGYGIVKKRLLGQPNRDQNDNGMGGARCGSPLPIARHSEIKL